jgi:hypothetical protein
MARRFQLADQFGTAGLSRVFHLGAENLNDHEQPKVLRSYHSLKSASSESEVIM